MFSDELSATDYLLSTTCLEKPAHIKLDMARLIAQGVELEDPFSLHTTRRAIIRGDSNLLYWLLEETQSMYRQHDLETRVRIAIEVCAPRDQPDVASLVHVILGDQQLTPTICHIKQGPHRTLLHCVSWHLGERYFRADQRYKFLLNIVPELLEPTTAEAPKGAIHRLLILTSKLIAAGSDLHALANRFTFNAHKRETPLLAIISAFMFQLSSTFPGFPWETPFRFTNCTALSPGFLATLPFRDNVLIPVFLWLSLLANSGVDLVEYGRKEKLAYNCSFPSFCSTRYYPFQKARKIFSFTFNYGARPEDWQVWLIPAMDNSFIEFWDMVDHPERAMPGYFDDYESEDGSNLDF
jgi:hypothetical protein